MIRHPDSAQQRIDQADRVLLRLADSSDPELEEHLYAAWISKADALREQEAFDSAVQTYDAMIAHGDNAASPAPPLWLAQALIGRGLALRAQGRHNEELASFEEVRKRYSESADTDIRTQLATAELHDASTRGEHGNTFSKVDIVRECQRIVDRYGKDSNIATQEVLARVQLLRADLLGQLDYRKEQQEALNGIYDNYSKLAAPTLRARGLQARMQQANILELAGHAHEAIALLDELRQAHDAATDLPVQEAHARAQHQLAYLLGETEQRERQLHYCNDMLAQYEHSDAPVIAEAAINVARLKAQAMQVIDGQADVLPLYDQVLRRYGEHPDGFVRNELAKTLHATATELQTLGREQESLASYDEVLNRYGEDASASMAHWVARAYLMKASVLSSLKRHDEALVALDALYARHHTATSPAMALNIGRGLIMQADILGELGKLQTQRNAYAEIARRYTSSTHADIRELASKARYRLQASLALETDALPQCTAIVDELMQHHAQDSRSTSRAYAANALFDLAVMLRARNEFKPALAAYDRLLQAFQSDTDPDIESRVASAYLNKGFLLMELLKRPADALPVYDALLAKFSHRTDPQFRDVLAKAAASRHTCLTRLNRSGSQAPYDNYQSVPVAERDSIDDTINQAHKMGASGQHQEAIALMDVLLSNQGASPHPELRRLMARARVERGFQLAQLGQSPQAISAFDEVIALYEADTSMHFQEMVALALYNKAIQYSKLEQPADEVAVYDDLITRFQSANTRELRERVAKSLFGRALTLERIDTPLAAIAAYDATVHHAADADEAVTRLQAARALISKAALYGKLGRHNDEVMTCQELIARFTGAEDPDMRARLISAHERMANAHEKLGQRAKQVNAYEALLARYGALMDANARHGIENNIIKAEPSVTRRLRLVLARAMRGGR